MTFRTFFTTQFYSYLSFFADHPWNESIISRLADKSPKAVSVLCQYFVPGCQHNRQVLSYNAHIKGLFPTPWNNCPSHSRQTGKHKVKCIKPIKLGYMKICADLTSINVILRVYVQFVAKQKDQKTTDAIANAQRELGLRF